MTFDEIADVPAVPCLVGLVRPLCEAVPVLQFRFCTYDVHHNLMGIVPHQQVIMGEAPDCSMLDTCGVPDPLDTVETVGELRFLVTFTERRTQVTDKNSTSTQKK